ncbi:HipA domain-containing protein [Rhizobacter sp. OV335]|uniref:HipA domain-containing protein n=1 Tax=Rhizobacter sp. OV335 TaxID=1500264 RepID=UPI00116136D6|nr:HipA domain-containing protein [Rhizobacter sp. OV335]
MATKSSRTGTAVVVPIRSTGDAQAPQLSLLPLQIDAEFESRFATADLKKVVRARDGHFYAVKSQTVHPLLPASEYLCYQLASACQIAVPFSAVLTDSAGRYFFGSRFEGGATELTAQGPTRGLEMFKQAAKEVSAALAFDLFVGNEDRHRNNFLFRKNYQEQWAPLAIDYSRALLVRDFPNDTFPVPESSNTRSTIKLMKASGLWQGPFAIFSLSTLQGVSAEHVLHWCNEMPEQWLPQERRQLLLNWWDSPAFTERLNAIYDLL